MLSGQSFFLHEQQAQIATLNRSNIRRRIDLQSKIQVACVKRDGCVHIINYIAHAGVRTCCVHMPRATITLVTKLGSERAACAGQSQPTEHSGDQPQHHGCRGTDYSIAGAGPAGGDGQIQRAVDQADQPRCQGY